jgi:cell division protein FtsB
MEKKEIDEAEIAKLRAENKALRELCEATQDGRLRKALEKIATTYTGDCHCGEIAKSALGLK